MRGPVLIAALALAPPAHAAPLARWAMFASTPQAVAGGTFEMEVYADGDPEAPAAHVRIVRTQHLFRDAKDDPQMRAVVTAADSGSCPQLRRRMAALRAAEAAQLKAPPPALSTLDGTIINIDAPLLGGRPGERMTLEQGESIGAIRDWIQGTVNALDPCWRPAG